MSYARFGAGGSDVYVYADVGGYINCCGCWLHDHGFKAYSTDEMIAHLNEHRDAGHCVLDNTYDDLRADAQENDEWIAKGGD